MFILLFILLHELAHVITIKSLNLSIYNVGIKLKPIPHFFVEFMWSRKQKENNLIRRIAKRTIRGDCQRQYSDGKNCDV